MVRFRFWMAALPAAAALAWIFPPFRVVCLSEFRREAGKSRFQPGPFVERFWAEKLLPSAAGAADATAVAEAARRDPASVRARFGRRAGLGDAYTLFVKGSGRVTSAGRGGIRLALDPAGSEVILETGPVVGNAVRDGPGLLDASDFPNSQDFNALSAELNRRIEERVLPALRSAAPGKTVRFAGCAEVADDSADLNPLRIIPFQVEVE